MMCCVYDVLLLLLKKFDYYDDGSMKLIIRLTITNKRRSVVSTNVTHQPSASLVV